jgi:pantoate kinase
MAMRIRVTTRAELFEKRKQQHIERGHRIEDERPIPVNGFCSFIAVSEVSDSNGIGDLVAQALNGIAR